MRILRYDSLNNYNALNDDNVIWEKDEYGYLKFSNLIITRVGDFPYLMPDGSTAIEKRTPEEVFKKSHLDSFIGKSITLLDNLGHPEEFLTPANDKKYSSGSLISAYKKDKDDVYLWGEGIFKDAIAIEKIESNIIGARNKKVDSWQVSAAYKTLVENGFQKDIVANHLSVVMLGRAGPVTKLNRDYALEFESQNSANEKFKDNDKTTLYPNHIIYETPMIQTNRTDQDFVNLHASLESEKAKSAQMKEQLDQLTAENQAVKTENESLKGDVQAMQSKLDSINAEAEKKDFISLAQKAGINAEVILKDVKLDSISTQELGYKLISGHNPKYIEKKDSSLDYFRGVVESIANTPASDAGVKFKLDSLVERQDVSAKSFNDIALEIQRSQPNN